MPLPTIGGEGMLYSGRLVVRPSVVRPLTPIERDAISPNFVDEFQ